MLSVTNCDYSLEIHISAARRNCIYLYGYSPSKWL